jgi:hypothetical protein
MKISAVKTWYDQRHGVINLDGDVLGIVQRVKEIDPRLSIYYNEQTDGYDLVESCLDGTDRLVFSVDELDQRLVDRLLKADHWGGDTPDHRDEFRPDDKDFASEMDKANEALLAAKDEESMEKVREAGERLAWALEEDGQGVRASILVPKDVK